MYVTSFFSVPPNTIRRMMTGLSELQNMTPSLKMVSWAATNQYAAKCRNWQRNCVNATPPPAQVSLLWLIRCFTSSYYISVMKEESFWVSCLSSEQMHFILYFILFISLSSSLKATVLAATLCSQCWRKGWDWKLVTRTGDIFRHHMIIFNFVLLFYWRKLQHNVSLCYRGTAVTVATASVPDAVPSRCWDLAWGQQVRRERLFKNWIMLALYCYTDKDSSCIMSLFLYSSLTCDLILLLLCLLQLQRPRERLCLFVLPVIPLSSSYNEMACDSCLPVASWRSFTVKLRTPSYWNPNTCLGFQVKALLSVKISPVLNSQTPPSPMSLPVASLLSYSWCLWDFCCNMFNISCINSQWRTGPNESVRLSTEHNGSKIIGPFSLCWAEGGAKRAGAEARIGQVVSDDTNKLIGCQWFCFYMLCLCTKLIPLECWCLQPCVAVELYCNDEKTFLREQDKGRHCIHLACF